MPRAAARLEEAMCSAEFPGRKSRLRVATRRHRITPESPRIAPKIRNIYVSTFHRGFVAYFIREDVCRRTEPPGTKRTITMAPGP